MRLDLRRTFWHPFSDQKSRKIKKNNIPKHNKLDRGKTWKKVEMYQNEAEFDAQNHQPSMSKQVAKQIMTRMKSMFF